VAVGMPARLVRRRPVPEMPAVEPTPEQADQNDAP